VIGDELVAMEYLKLWRSEGWGTMIRSTDPVVVDTVRSEYPELVRGSDLEQQALAVARQSLLIDELLLLLRDRGELELQFAEELPGRRPVLFHAHCHQKAFAKPGASLELLRLAGYEAELVNADCCGMAGAFGYEKEHYGLSRAAGERGLFPAVRAREDADIVVLGVSCRQQVEHFTGRPTRHLAEMLRDALREPASSPAASPQPEASRGSGGPV